MPRHAYIIPKYYFTIFIIRYPYKPIQVNKAKSTKLESTK